MNLLKQHFFILLYKKSKNNQLWVGGKEVYLLDSVSELINKVSPGYPFLSCLIDSASALFIRKSSPRLCYVTRGLDRSFVYRILH